MNESITFEEFKMWLNGLIQGKNGSLPDIEDWKLIKKMMDRVQSQKMYSPSPEVPYNSPWNIVKYPTVTWESDTIKTIKAIKAFESCWTTTTSDTKEDK